MNGFTGIEPGFQLVYRNSLHIGKLILIAAGGQGSTIAFEARFPYPKPNFNDLAHMDMINWSFSTQLRAVLVIDKCPRRIPHRRVPVYIADTKPEGIQPRPGLEVCQPRQVGHYKLLTTDPATQYQCNGTTLLDDGARFDRFAVILLIQHGITGEVRLIHRVLDIQSILPEDADRVPERHADQVGHLDHRSLRPVDRQIDGAIGLDQVIRFRELFDNLHWLHRIDIRGGILDLHFETLRLQGLLRIGK